ncbi:MAG: site-2 protease family protein [Deltaproteobacteria bacterium]|nr:site-2 protease family protein [Deltaproteobacteria bacterium]
MKWSWKLGRIAGIDTQVHASFLLLVAWAAWRAWAGAGTGLAVVLGVGFLLAVFGSVLLHELGHALVARRYGIATRRIILSPIGGIAQLEGMPSLPRQELAVALAGPAVNFVLAAGLWIIQPAFAGFPVLAELLGGLLIANLILGIFNLVPAFPMDGGRALRALLAGRIGSRRATQAAARVGKGVALFMGVGGLFWWSNPMLVLVAGFVWFAANAELRASQYDDYLDEVDVMDHPSHFDRRSGWREQVSMLTGFGAGRPRARRRSWRDIFARPTAARRTERTPVWVSMQGYGPDLTRVVIVHRR